MKKNNMKTTTQKQIPFPYAKSVPDEKIHIPENTTRTNHYLSTSLLSRFPTTTFILPLPQQYFRKSALSFRPPCFTFFNVENHCCTVPSFPIPISTNNHMKSNSYIIYTCKQKNTREQNSHRHSHWHWFDENNYAFR